MKTIAKPLVLILELFLFLTNSFCQTNSLTSCTQVSSTQFSNLCNILDADPTNTFASCSLATGGDIIINFDQSIQITNPSGPDITINAAFYSYNIYGSRDNGVTWIQLTQGSGNLSIQTINLEVNSTFNKLKFSFGNYGGTIKVADVKVYGIIANIGYFDQIGIGTRTTTDLLNINGNLNTKNIYDYSNRSYYLALSSTSNSLNAAGKLNAQSLGVTGQINSGSIVSSGNIQTQLNSNIFIGQNLNSGTYRLLFNHNGMHAYIDYKENLYFRADQPSLSVLTLYGDGSVGIGFATTYTAGNYPTKGYKLAIAGSMIAEQVVVKLQTNWPDKVFLPNYNLRSLAEVENYIKSNNHLEGIPSETDVKMNGINVADMNAELLKKIEELTLYVIQQQKEIENLKEEIREK